MMFRHPHPLAETTDASTADAEKDRWTAGPSTTLRSGRDDKGEGRFRGEQLQEEKPFFIILGGPPMIPPVGMTTIFRCIYSGLYRIVIPTGAKRSGGTCGFSCGHCKNLTSFLATFAEAACK
jgi:hypothetical protein